MLSFPPSPSLNQLYPDPAVGSEPQWQWDGMLWRRIATIIQPPPGTGGPIGETIWFNSNSAPANFLIEDGSAYATGPFNDLFNVLVVSGPASVSISSPGIVTWFEHGRSRFDPVFFITNGSLPTGLTASNGATITTYYILTVLSPDTFTVSATAGGAAINFTGSTTGSHMAINAPFGVPNTDLSQFRVPNMLGNFIRGWDNGNTIDVSRAFGTLQLDQNLQHQHGTATGQIFGYNGTGGYTVSPGSGWAIMGTTGLQSTARWGTEARPRNVAKLPCIRYQ